MRLLLLDSDQLHVVLNLAKREFEMFEFTDCEYERGDNP